MTEPYIGMRVSKLFPDTADSKRLSDWNFPRPGTVVAVYPAHHWYMVRFDRGYCEGFFYIPSWLEEHRPEPDRYEQKMVGKGSW